MFYRKRIEELESKVFGLEVNTERESAHRREETNELLKLLSMLSRNIAVLRERIEKLEPKKRGRPRKDEKA